MSSTDGSNSGLTDDHRRALAYHHLGKWDVAKARQARATADVRNVIKRAKAEGVPLTLLEDLKKLETPEGEAALKERMLTTLQAAGWSNSEIGTQFSFEDIPDRSPLTERAYREGKTAGMKGETASSPYEGDAEQEWLRGHADGQSLLMETLNLTKQGMRDLEAEKIAKAEAKAARAAEKQAQADKPKKPRGRPKKAKANGAEPVAQTDIEDQPAEQDEPVAAFEG